MDTAYTMSPNVFHNKSNVSVLGSYWIEELTEAAQKSPLRRARLCLHRSNDAPVHEMIIALMRDCRFPPHRHPHKEESIHVISGELAVVLYADSGTEIDRIFLAPPPLMYFAYRLCVPTYHTVIPRSEVVIYHEVTSGPWSPGDTEVAPWA